MAGEEQQEVARLQDALAHREKQLASQPVIEQAKGMLKQDFGLGDEDAFEFLVAVSQDSNTKVRDVAARVVSVLTGSASRQTASNALDRLQALRDRLRDED